MPDPCIYERWQDAKKAAGVLARACGADLLQLPDGTKRIIIGHVIKDAPTWLCAWGILYRIRKDQITRKK